MYIGVLAYTEFHAIVGLITQNPHGTPPRPCGTVSFGPFEVRIGSGELLKRGRRVRLQQQPFQILSALLASPGEVVTREHLHQQLWSRGTFVEFEHGLNAAISRLREIGRAHV